jgi:PKD repeat protein
MMRMQSEIKTGAIVGVLSLAVGPLCAPTRASDVDPMPQKVTRTAQVLEPEPRVPQRPTPTPTPPPRGTPSKAKKAASVSKGSRVPWKWLFLGTATANAGAGAYLLLRNETPAPGAILYSPAEVGIAGLTEFEFRAQGARDPEGKTLSYAWDFGDGGKDNGSPVKHRFAQAGTFRVVLTVSDGKKSATTEDQIVVRDLSGRWRGTFATYEFTMELTQSASGLTGTYTDRDGSGTLRGELASPRSVELRVTQRSFAEIVFHGTVDSQASKITGLVFGESFSMSR